MSFSIVIAVIAAALLVVIFMLIRSVKTDKSTVKNVSQKIEKKGSSAVIREAEKKLAHDPHNVDALEMLGDVYLRDKVWDKVWSVYKTLYDIAPAHVEIDIAKCGLRMGIAAFNLDKLEEAAKALMVSLKKNPDNFESNLYLGKTFNKKGVYDKAIYCFRKAKILMPENSEVNELLGLSLFRFQKYRDCLPYLKRVLEEKPDDKELLYDMAVAMSECGMGEKALKVFVHLRPDPVFGPQSCLEAGKMHEKPVENHVEFVENSTCENLGSVLLYSKLNIAS